ncbi:30S ribosomal protein S9 [candidate division CSSED10-310 bacterium]|uniref:Small ribosomal subunit protein uS9 n=1 Tax=candidate division CSSED10-310 bacterium TaxID=2855610 RepID=A0ABV6YVT7_UNCC1
MEINKYYGTGKRKNAIARVWIKSGKGDFTVNKRTLNDYFPRETLKMVIKQPFELTGTLGRFDIYATVKGGGISGQASALKHGITKALIQYNKELRPQLKKAGFVRRDPRVKERKKYGQRGARARYQFSKR